MNFTKLYILFLSVLINYTLAARSNNDSVFKRTTFRSLYLTEASDNKKQLLKESVKKLNLFIFLSPECPLCRRYSSFLKNLYRQFNGDVEFYGIIPGKAYSVDEVKKYKEEYTIPFSLFIDENKELSNYLQASVTPQVILLNRNYEMVYKGAIDDLLMQLGKQRIKATEDFLVNAISQSLHNEKIFVKRTKAVGCRINDY